MSLTLWTVVAPTSTNKTLGAFTTRHRERMLLQSTDDWALRLHSCRALSSTIATQSYNKSFHNEITVDKPHARPSLFRRTALSSSYKESQPFFRTALSKLLAEKRVVRLGVSGTDGEYFIHRDHLANMLNFSEPRPSKSAEAHRGEQNPGAALLITDTLITD